MLGLIASLLLWLISFLAIAFFAGSETALVHLDNLTVKHLLGQRAKGAQVVAELMEDKQRLLGVLLVGTNLAVVISTVTATILTRNWSFYGVNGATLSTWGMVVLILIFGEIIPKRLATQHASRIALRTAVPVRFFYRLFLPLASLLVAIPRVLSNRLRIEDDDLSIDEESLLTMVDMGEEEGAVDEEERDMIFGVLEANHTLVREIMTPRVDMVTVATDDPPEEVLEQIVHSGFSRIPVYEDTVDNIVGILYAKDLLEHWRTKDAIDLAALMREPYFVPETKNTSDLLREFKKLRLHMAIIVDEYGGTAGLVTFEDLLEEIVGDIQDEYDWDEEDEVVQVSDNVWMVDARMSIDDINELTEVELSDEHVDTIGGLAYQLLGRIPAPGEQAEIPEQGIRLAVAETTGRRITRIRLSRIPIADTEREQ